MRAPCTPARSPRPFPPAEPPPEALRPLSVLVLGAGAMGGVHARALAGLPGVSLAGVVSRRRDSARRLARALGTRMFPALRPALRAARPDAVWICTPTDTHRALALEAAAAGAHVFCEKPLAGSLRDAEAVLRAVRKAGVRFMVGHVLRFFPEYATLRRLVRDGTLGAPGVIRMSRGAKYPEGRGSWYADPKRSGGPLLDMVIHDFDWLRWTFGPVKRVHARATRAGGARPSSYALALVRLASGPMAHVETFWGHGLPFRATAEIAGSAGLAEYDSAQPAALSLQREGGRGLAAVEIPGSPLAVSPYEAEDRSFLEAIRGGKDPAVSGEEAYEALRIGLAAVSSARTGKPVTLA